MVLLQLIVVTIILHRCNKDLTYKLMKDNPKHALILKTQAKTALESNNVKHQSNTVILSKQSTSMAYYILLYNMIFIGLTSH